MKKPPTVYDVAQAAGVSTATVSFAFRQPERVKLSTREAVRAVARELGYVPSASARGLAAGHTGALGLASWDLLPPSRDQGPENDPLQAEAWDVLNRGLRYFPRYVDEIQHGAAQAAWRNGYALMLGGGNHENSESKIIDIAGRVDGLLVLPHTVSDETIQNIGERIPLATLSHSGISGVSKITSDNEGGIESLALHLLDVHEVRHVEFFGATQSVEPQSRFETLCRVLSARGLPHPTRSLGDIHQIAQVVARLTSSTLPEAIVCGTDSEALELIDVLGANGVQIPKNLKVTGFDDIAACRLSAPQLTTIRQPMQAMGFAAVEMVVERIRSPSLEPSSRQFAVELVIRESCGCSPAEP